MISYKEALFDWVEANEADLREDYRRKFGSYPTDDDRRHWASWCQRQFDDMLATVPEHDD